MTVYALLEPLPCRTSMACSPVGGLASDLADPTLAWSVCLVGWQPARGGVLPDGLTRHSDGPASHVTGVLSRHHLACWVRELSSCGEAPMADLLTRTLAAHMAPAPVLRGGDGQSGPGQRGAGQGSGWSLDLSRPRIMGILNVTPDSFSGDGVHQRMASAVAQGVRMAEEGADILDVGGESSRPGAASVRCDEELDRVVPVVQALAREVDVPIAVDTCKPEVMRSALEAGATMINDITALRSKRPHQGAPGGGLGAVTEGPSVQGADLGAAAEGWLGADTGVLGANVGGLGVETAAMETEAPDADMDFLTHAVAHREVPIVLMHMQGTPGTMQKKPTYRHVCAEVYAFLAERLRWCVAQGIARHRLIIDPGIGFGKTLAHNLDLLHHLRLFRGLGAPLLLGVSRKRLVGAMSGEPDAGRRDVASHVLGAMAVLGGAHILRVHDVVGARQALAVAHAWSHGLDTVS